VGALIDSCRTKRRLALVLGLTVGLLAACGGDAGETVDRKVSVSDAWALSTVTGQPNGAVYLTVVSAAADTLQRIVVPSSIADRTEIHDTVTNANGEMAMQEMSSGVTLDPGTAVTFTPGGKHVMLVDLVEPLAAGQRFDVTLEFGRADSVTLPVAVLESAP
jgi:periplasmic copper chaperone A